MRALAEMGLAQGVLPPQHRPDVAALRGLGFACEDAEVLGAALKAAPEVLASAASASSMWTANAATICPRADSLDGKTHFTAANLMAKFHRSIESATTTRALRAIFPDERLFAHHPALAPSATFGDEGAANHTRFCRAYGEPGLQLFVYGRSALAPAGAEPKRFPGRQTIEASQAIMRLNRARPERCVFAQQNPGAIDAGAFHNDVVSVGNKNLLFYHEEAFLDSRRAIGELKEKFAALCGEELAAREVSSREVPLADAIKSYLFNSQLISLPSGSALIAPEECREVESVRRYLDATVGAPGSPIREMRFFDLRQSMRNGGGPACLRLRVVLAPDELAAVNPGALATPALIARLEAWVNKHYRDRLAPADLADPELAEESRRALDELTQVMGLGSIYPFQLQASGRA
jgi:succinylarginine dihydrolase